MTRERVWVIKQITIVFKNRGPKTATIQNSGYPKRPRFRRRDARYGHSARLAINTVGDKYTLTLLFELQMV